MEQKTHDASLTDPGSYMRVELFHCCPEHAGAGLDVGQHVPRAGDGIFALHAIVPTQQSVELHANVAANFGHPANAQVRVSLVGTDVTAVTPFGIGAVY